MYVIGSCLSLNLLIEFSSESDGSIKEPRKKKSKHSHHRSKHHKHHHSKKNNDLKKVKEKISAEDYFRKSAEYRKWLSEKVPLTVFQCIV
jgi:hypothetical protein